MNTYKNNLYKALISPCIFFSIPSIVSGSIPKEERTKHTAVSTNKFLFVHKDGNTELVEKEFDVDGGDIYSRYHEEVENYKKTGKFQQSERHHALAQVVPKGFMSSKQKKTVEKLEDSIAIAKKGKEIFKKSGLEREIILSMGDNLTQEQEAKLHAIFKNYMTKAILGFNKLNVEKKAISKNLSVPMIEVEAVLNQAPS